LKNGSLAQAADTRFVHVERAFPCWTQISYIDWYFVRTWLTGSADQFSN
jgi:hypothetical protein